MTSKNARIYKKAMRIDELLLAADQDAATIDALNIKYDVAMHTASRARALISEQSETISELEKQVARMVHASRFHDF